jgi:hypothetical protein
MAFLISATYCFKLKASSLGDDVKLELMRQLDEKHIAYPNPEQWKLYHYGEHFKGKWPLYDRRPAYNPLNLVVCLAAASSRPPAGRRATATRPSATWTASPPSPNEELLKSDCEDQENELIAITDEWSRSLQGAPRGSMVEGDWVGYQSHAGRPHGEELKEGGYYR